jgi:hypothetical protein
VELRCGDLESLRLAFLAPTVPGNWDDTSGGHSRQMLATVNIQLPKALMQKVKKVY